MFYKCFTIIYIHLCWFIFSITHTGNGHESQIFLSGIIYYTFIPTTKFEGRCTEILGHVMMKVIRSIEHELNVYLLIK